ncbi:unnamed protein product [Bursaphelenchus okinawaensis]|uniref:NOC3-like protein n=1 Tax=Bursaphelenchus okinawaensis TaxID=465554 RepID=A0A811LD91_9BILA|nr:unnamed protein product [Bursaphelenchus okinawaensis]CAG9121785.1 unnamed protein product [Bursaphelenchus okinawaensis]
MGKKEKSKPPVSAKQRRKATQRILKLKKKGKLSGGLDEEFTEYRQRRQHKHADLANRIEEDWLADRVFHDMNEDNHDYVPLDMVNDFEERRSKNNDIKDEDLDELRHFKEDEEVDQELLPLKVNGEIVRRLKKKTKKVEEDIDVDEETETSKKPTIKGLQTDVDDMEVDEEGDEEKPREEDLSKLTPVDRLVRTKELMKETENKITNYVKNLSVDPQGQMNCLSELMKIASGFKVHSAIREPAQLMAIACLTEVYIDIAPGYHIRPLTEEEKAQSMKKETKKLVEFEERLLQNYLKFLTSLEKNAMKLVKPSASQINEKNFTTEIGLLSVNSLANLIAKLSHFNFAVNLIDCMVKIATSAYKPVVEVASASLREMFEADPSFRLSLFVVKSIGQLVGSKKYKISQELLNCLLGLKIKNIDRRDREAEMESLKNKKHKILKEHKSKTAKKFDKQMKKVEADLKEIEASESLSNKLKTSTEVMKHLFALYFRVLKRMPEPRLISPVLAGLSKFAHLINIDFFDDLISTLEDLIGEEHLSTIDSLNCVKTMCVILSAEGQALNIDPIKFYKELYKLMPNIAFQKDLDKQNTEIRALCQCLDSLINRRKKQVPFSRVVSYTKRLLQLGFMLTPRQLLAVLATIRTHFITHPKLCTLVEDDEDYCAAGLYRPDFEDPDHTNAQSTDFVAELNKYLKYPNSYIVQYAKHLLQQAPSSGQEKLNGQWSTMKPWEWLNKEEVKQTAPPFRESINTFAKKKNIKFCSKNVCSTIDSWVQQK